MNASEANPLGQPDITFTLDPILEDGQAALSTHDTPGIAQAKLRRVDIAWSNAFQEVTILKADDLLSERPRPPIPRRGKLVHAIFDLFFPGSANPGKLHLIPPRVAYLENAADPGLIHAWLSKRHFELPKQIARTLAVLLLAIASALSPTMDDDDTDDDDNHKIYAA